MNRLFAAAAAVILSAQSAAAFVYECDITHPSPDGWMGDKIIFGVDEENGTAAVADPVILSLQKVPLMARLETTDKRHTFRWKLKDIPTRNETEAVNEMSKADYRAVVFRKTNKLALTVTLHGYDNTPRGTGSCTIKER